MNTSKNLCLKSCQIPPTQVDNCISEFEVKTTKVTKIKNRVRVLIGVESTIGNEARGVPELEPKLLKSFYFLQKSFSVPFRDD